jgi:DnaK suppressor protein
MGYPLTVGRALVLRGDQYDGAGAPTHQVHDGGVPIPDCDEVDDAVAGISWREAHRRKAAYSWTVDPDRAHDLLRRERSRVESEIAALARDGPLEGSDQLEPGDRGSENVYQDEFDAGRLADLRSELAAVERAEARLQAGTYGISVVSGTPIPDARLEVLPTAERTVDEERDGG